MIDDIYGVFWCVNGVIVILLGVVLILMVFFILFDVLLWCFGFGLLGGLDEVLGYVMVVVVSWGFVCVLMDCVYVCIDLICQKLVDLGWVLMDIFVMIVIILVILLIVVKCWLVLFKILISGVWVNILLQMFLWILQGIWFVGWVWFVVIVIVFSLIVIYYFVINCWVEFEVIIGIGLELDI